MKHIFLSILMLLHSLTFSFPLWAEQIPASKIILVTGATGTQGGAVARVLLKRGYIVRGLTRNPAGDQAQALRELGIIMVKGDFDDAKALGAAMTDAYGVFAVTEPKTNQRVADALRNDRPKATC